MDLSQEFIDVLKAVTKKSKICNRYDSGKGVLQYRGFKKCWL